MQRHPFSTLKAKTVEKMESDRCEVPIGIMKGIEAAYSYLQDTSRKLVKKIDDLAAQSIQQKIFTLGMTKYDDEAQKSGRPCADTRTVIGALAVHNSSHDVRLVERSIPYATTFRLGSSVDQLNIEGLKVT